ncbi:hypothetical protein B0H17DRAFT_1032399 [Mycena rosella]|uniref:Secreted protein n=1 Tax=Mycena rosella TaxID=1033263 RepID=A0AAD7MA31_MYCRO|nr:hypothetical protein B0H17DRAFT_1032399 [Mycena rosella]
MIFLLVLSFTSFTSDTASPPQHCPLFRYAVAVCIPDISRQCHPPPARRVASCRVVSSKSPPSLRLSKSRPRMPRVSPRFASHPLTRTHLRNHRESLDRRGPESALICGIHPCCPLKSTSTVASWSHHLPK